MARLPGHLSPPGAQEPLQTHVPLAPGSVVRRDAQRRTAASLVLTATVTARAAANGNLSPAAAEEPERHAATVAVRR